MKVVLPEPVEGKDRILIFDGLINDPNYGKPANNMVQ
jgi:hypothetical protein